MSSKFISVVQDLEDLLCHHIASSAPTDFIEVLSNILKNVLNNDRTPYWSIQSFLYDFRDEYFRQPLRLPPKTANQLCLNEGLTKEQPGPIRPSHDIWPRLNRAAVEPLSNMPMTHDQGSDPWSFAVRIADQVYNVLRLQAKMPHKPFIEVLAENGFIAGPAEMDYAATHCRPTDGCSDQDQIQDRQEYDVNVHARLTFLEDRVRILEKREELLEGQLERAAQAMAAMRSTNLELARKVSEVQQRNHELTRTYAV
ncbi:hypothetical protein Trco_002808 [Trichoderma cornu-damae]|uniref:Uncharacterized protein n=1 Tax=Trichoderma cornu-damae TaxID=654480 RepID=A0A9P8QVP4_9HYPO|nr:hypothetical protein Trco_002808 [Trichoderma cornu-damae]